MFNILRILESTLPTLKTIIGRCYFCQDTENLYFDTKIGRIPQVYTLIGTELERQELSSPMNGYYYVYETNTLWTYSMNYSWRVYAENNPNYPSQYIDEISATYNIIADSFNLLVNQNRNDLGSLIINPEISVEVLNSDRETLGEGIIERVVTTHDFGKMVFNGDICYQKDGKLTVVRMDDGCLDNLDITSEYEDNDIYFICSDDDLFCDYNDKYIVVKQ